ncbi:Structural maintenance of chromosomes protein 3 [Gracilariopsis chorda]|uniref:Structural maintenance of chromosomes protein n=1 Tax=Gracilariopsis chorda TaxID=448386 RepID=A0A2V3IGT1_9FLOR|nr:Structural maintenance of chromosomes protein 3 [Gracilariopsis chorda]|eukprot:PXF41262.1 Structural maintenance of chromosomes protein 3 [Gracilariopsis chorda]
MHIKQITITGFKSYRSATVAGPFSPAHNVVVGRNGSGKSNFFDAVRFVLSDTFSNLRAEERVALLHEGAGASVLSAYVEMTFDNSDGRLPIDKDEVLLRRMIGLKKDEYTLDWKNVSRTEVFNLLESAGFSRSNPYYIVQQGKVAALCAMTDHQRLELLQEVAGTRVYDERRKESLKLMEDADAKREKIVEVIDSIESRLSELESEKEELKAFQRLDKERKALQYTIHVRELEEAKAALEALEDDRGQQRSRADKLNAHLTDVCANITTAERELKSLGPELKRAEEDREAIDKRRKLAVEKIAKLQVGVAEAEKAASTTAETVANTKSEMEELHNLMIQKRAELEPLEAELTNVKGEEETIRKQIDELRSSLLRLRVKANRSNQFSTVEERNSHLRRSIREARNRKRSLEQKINTRMADMDRLQQGIVKNEEKCVARRKEREELQAESNASNSELQQLSGERDRVFRKRQDLWRQESEISAKIRELQDGISKLEANKRSVIGSSMYYALNFIAKLSRDNPRDFGPDKVYGPLLELIDVDTRYSTAADVTAGGALTHVIVNNDETAAKLVRALREKRAGRVTFIPLNRMSTDSRPPPPASADSVPLLNKIRSDPLFSSVVKHVFGRVLVAKTIQIASDLARQHNVDCITLDGDQVNRRGGMRGGYVDTSRNRIDAARFLREAGSDLRGMQEKKGEINATLEQVNDNLNRLMGEVQRRNVVKRNASIKIERLDKEIHDLERFMEVDRRSIENAQNQISDAEEAIVNVNKSIEDMEKELQSPMISGLSSQEENQLSESKDEIETLRTSRSEKMSERASVERRVLALRAELKGSLEKREAELKKSIAAVAGDALETSETEDLQQRMEENLKRQQDALQEAEEDLGNIRKELKEAEANLVQKKRAFNQKTAFIEQNRNEEARVNKAIEDDRQQIEKKYSQRAIETQKKTDAEKNIRELGSLPADFDKYRDMSIGSLMKRLKKANEGLRKYSHVNKKALDQYLNFSEKREALSQQREELDSGAAAIRQLIDSLDQRKDEDILRTFKGVSKFFSEVFKELVPGGRASLVMLKSSDDTRVQQGTPASRIQYTGVAMKVAFSSTGQAYLLQQLSGGQKSIVALALIFAIQRLDPAPFYLFDEIDANLDATHRQAVANLIRKQANSGTQFITTTFRPEFVNAGDMWYGVTHKKKVSGIQEVGRDVALTFITDEPTTR